MTNPWDPLVSQLTPLLKSSLQDLVDLGKDEVQSFIKNQAEQYAKQTWLSVNAPSDDDKAEALDNLKHLKAQVVVDAMDLKIVATARVLGLLTKAFNVIEAFLIQYGPTLIAAL